MTLSLGMTLLILLAAAMHAGWNVMVKIGSDAFLNMSLIVGLGGLLALFVTPFVDFPDRASWIYLFGSCMAHLGYYTFLVLAYRHGELSLVYPIARGSAPPLVALAAFLLPTHQILSPLQMAGVVSISAGILSLAADKPVDRAHKWEAIAFGLLTGLTIMSYTLFDGEGIRNAGETHEKQIGYIVWLFVLDAPLLATYALWTRGAEARVFVRKNWKLGLCGAALSLAAYGIAIIAMRFGEFAHVSALRETSVIFAALMSAYLLKERFRKRRYVSVTLVALGAVLLH
ncbi:EamA family transporter [Dongia sedimenti]|uniref:EamA family transporter n=1 Tax=Dongia sedimenti TaxID=3064282 RepID=A0ABU0YID2_9PROT|nr:EamA family transporter [Rhodospirillaceae bacterium R-7]